MFSAGVPVTGVEFGLKHGSDNLIIKTTDGKWYASGQHLHNVLANGRNDQPLYFTEVGTELSGTMVWVQTSGVTGSSNETGMFTMANGRLFITGNGARTGVGGVTPRPSATGNYVATDIDGNVLTNIVKGESAVGRAMMAFTTEGELLYSYGKHAYLAPIPPGYVRPALNTSGYGLQKIDKPGDPSSPVVDLKAGSLSPFTVLLADGTMWGIGCNGTTIGGPGGMLGTGVAGGDEHWNEWIQVRKDSDSGRMIGPDDWAVGGNGTGYITGGQYYMTGNNNEGQWGTGAASLVAKILPETVTMPTINGTAATPVDTTVSFYDTHMVIMQAAPVTP